MAGTLIIHVLWILCCYQTVIIATTEIQLNVSISERVDDMSYLSDEASNILQYEIQSEITSATLSQLKGLSLKSATLELEFSIPCFQFKTILDDDTKLIPGQLGSGEVNLISSGSCLILSLDSSNFTLSYDFKAGSHACSVRRTFQMSMDPSLLDLTECSNYEDDMEFLDLEVILKSTTQDTSGESSIGLVSAAISLEAEDPSCNFDNGCRMQFDPTAIFSWTQGSTSCDLKNAGEFLLWKRLNVSCNASVFIPKQDTTFGSPEGVFGLFLPTNQSLSTSLSTPIIQGSSAGCTLQMSAWIHRGHISIALRTTNLTKTLDDIGNKNQMATSWQNVSVHIGSMRTSFSLEILLHSEKGIVAVDDISLSQCGDSEDKETTAVCGGGDFRCSTCKWIPNSRLCDLIPDCLFGEDEHLPLCYETQWNGSCSFENGWCGWENISPYKDITQCLFERANYTDIDHHAETTDGVVLHMKGTQCASNTDASIYREMPPMFYANNTCQLRFSMKNAKYYGVTLYEPTNTMADTMIDLVAELIPPKTSKWNQYTVTLPKVRGRFALEIWAQVFMKEDVLLDFVSLSPGCFKHGQEVHNDSIMFLRIEDTVHQKSEVLLIVTGCLTGAVAGLAALSLFILAMRWRRQRMHVPCKKLAYRKNSSHSSSTTMSCLDDKHHLQHEALIEDETAHSDRQASLNGSICTMTVSPYYEWIQESDEMIRNIPRSKIRLVSMIGKGAFGEVYYGLLADVAHLRKELPVAIKTLPSLCSEQTKSEFFFEAIILSKFKNPNIIRFLGISIDERSMFVVLELMEGGDLRSFVRDERPREKGDMSTLSTLDLLKLSLDIAKGCYYLESNKFIHRDIAARNCLLTEKGPNRVAKIGDFGMAREIFRTNYYRKKGVAMIPVKWMPPEAFMDGVFTSKTDVWAFGVVLWEVFTMGFVPYPGKTNAEVMKYVLSHGRLSQPPLCSGELFELMQNCWKSKPKDRPGFHTIVDKITKLKRDHKNEDKITLHNLSKDPAPFEISLCGDPEEQSLIETNGNVLNSIECLSCTSSPGHVSLISMPLTGNDVIS